MAKICKWLLLFLAATTILSVLFALLSVVFLFLSFFGSQSSTLGWLFVLSLATIPGIIIALIGIILGWIGGFLGKLMLSVVSVVLISIGVAGCFLVFLPLCSIFIFVIALALGITCIRKQKKHNEYEENI